MSINMAQSVRQNRSRDAKTCSFFLQGRCKFGSSCTFVHEAGSEAPTLPDTKTPSVSDSPIATSVTSKVRAKNFRRGNGPGFLPKGGSAVNHGSNKGRQAQSRSEIVTGTVHRKANPSGSVGPMRHNSTQSKGKNISEGKDTSSGRVQSTSSTNHARPKKGEIPCRTWKSGSCAKGNKCWFSHDPQVQEVERLREADTMAAETEARRRTQMDESEAALRAQIDKQEAIREAERIKQDIALLAESHRQETARRAQQKAEREAAQKAYQAEQENARRIQQEARKAEIRKEEANKTIQHIILGSIVTFSAGLVIQHAVTGFESCHVRVKNLPLDARYDDVCALFTQQGIDPAHFYIVGMKKLQGGKQEADILIEAQSGKLVSIGLDGIEFGQENLIFEVSENGVVGGMGASGRLRPEILTVSWRAPSVCFVAEYCDVHYAEVKVRELNRKICGGRRVKVEMNRPPPGRVLNHFRPNSVKISGLPLGITDADIAEFSGSTLLRRLKSTDYDVDQALHQLRQHMESYADGLVAFDTVSGDSVDGTFVIRAQFHSSTQAKKVHDSLIGQRFPYIANSTFWLQLPDPLQYTITIPVEQYQAQTKQWQSLIESTRDNEACHLQISTQDRVWIRVTGNDRKAVGSLKVRVENVAEGEKLEGWHRSLGNQFLNSVLKATGAFVRSDWRLQTLKVYGDPAAVQKAHAMVESEIERLASFEWSVFLKRQSIGFFVRHGLSALKETIGEDSVTLNISSSPCKITIRGGEEARHTLDRLIKESLSDVNVDQGTTGSESKCPICYDDVSSAVVLACGHIYCTPCIRHFLATASDTKMLPLSCLGDEAKCGVPIPIPTIQKFLPPQQFNHLLKVAFTSYLEQHPQEFKYCKTPDCSQIYRCNSSTSLGVHCPSCFLAVCPSCHEEEHEGMSCADRKLFNDPAEQERLNEEWATQQGVKKCPSCKVWIEKIDGCNHMSCKCGAHICWWCMGIFSPDDIYNHMNMVHVVNGDE